MSRRFVALSGHQWPEEVNKGRLSFPLPKTTARGAHPQKDPPGWRLPKYLAAVRKVACSTCHESRKSHPHHIRFGTAGRMAGLGRKPPDWFCVPLCVWCHTSLHNHRHGEEEWWRSRAIDAYAYRKEMFTTWLAAQRRKTDPDLVVAMLCEVRDQFYFAAHQEQCRRRNKLLGKAEA